jgi:hypothetical protein
MQFIPYEPEIQISGASMFSLFDAFGRFRLLLSRFLTEEKLGSRDEQGRVTLDRSGWYSQAAGLRAFCRMGSQLGEEVLARVGQRIPANSNFPASLDIEQALGSLDVAYHLNHLKEGRVMFDPSSGKMQEGIGHYHYDRKGPRRGRAFIENPYPCVFDQALLAAISTRYAPAARVEHEAGTCRRHGGRHCAYRISW